VNSHSGFRQSYPGSESVQTNPKTLAQMEDLGEIQTSSPQFRNSEIALNRFQVHATIIPKYDNKTHSESHKVTNSENHGFTVIENERQQLRGNEQPTANVVCQKPLNQMLPSITDSQEYSPGEGRRLGRSQCGATKTLSTDM